LSKGTFAFAIPGDPDQRTGGYIYDRRLGEALARRGWHVSPLSLPSGFPYPGPGELLATRDRFAALPDGALVMVDGLAFAVMPEIAAAEAARLRLVALVHHPLAYETGLAPDVMSRLRASERRALAAARRVVVTSQATRTTLIDDFGVVADRITVALPGADPQPPAQGSGGRKLTLLAVGSVIPRKDFPTLVEALAGLADLPWRLVIVGSLERSREEAARLRAAIERHGLAGRIVLEGELDGEALDRAYDHADVLVSVSRYEGFGMALAEGIARALPIVAVVGGAVGGWLPPDAAIRVPPDDPAALCAALPEVIADPERRTALREGAIAARATLPTWDDTALAVEVALLQASAA